MIDFLRTKRAAALLRATAGLLHCGITSLSAIALRWQADLPQILIVVDGSDLTLDQC